MSPSLSGSRQASVTKVASALGDFVRAFRAGILEEISAMRDRLGLEDIALASGLEIERDEENRRWSYQFAHHASVGRLGAGHECTLMTPGAETTVTIRRIDLERLEVVAAEPVDVSALPISLSLAPWFLYQRLIDRLEGLDVGIHNVDLAMKLFGRGQPHRSEVQPMLAAIALNNSQRDAIKLSIGSELAFIWGPPGTGKTTTLANLVEEFLVQGKRVLLASNTNAALDQVLAKVSALPQAMAAAERGEIVRLGHTAQETYGTALREVLDRLHSAHLEALGDRLGHAHRAEQLVARGSRLLDVLSATVSPQQSLFAEPTYDVSAVELTDLVPDSLREASLTKTPHDLHALLERRVARFKLLASLSKRRVSQLRRALRDLEAETLARAKVTLSTLANAYLSPQLESARFDVVVVDEASMAPLPALFYAACLADDRVVMVGDPRQLPPIVRSDRSLARRVLGRNIFDVTVPEPSESSLVAMLDTQYRMCPAIGALVGELFYEGRLLSDSITRERADIAAGAPHPNQALVVVDTTSKTLCQRAKTGSSRTNELSAAICIELAAMADADGERSVALITPYAAQSRALNELAARRGLSGRVECSTIHRFQGQERDVVILDLVDTAPMPPSRMLSESDMKSSAARLLNVSMSRAVGKLIIVADVTYFDSELSKSVATRAIRHAIELGARVEAVSAPLV